MSGDYCLSHGSVHHLPTCNIYHAQEFNSNTIERATASNTPLNSTTQIAGSYSLKKNEPHWMGLEHDYNT